jgi:hypothetical protein
MKIFEVYKSIVNERQIEACVKNFGEELFSPQLGGDEPNTRLEDRYLELIHRFTDNEYGEETNPDFVSALNNLKRCTTQYPEILIPQDTTVYRGVTLPISYFIENKLIIAVNKEYPYVYKARTPLQSWSTSKIASQLFGNNEILNEMADEIDIEDYQTPETRQDLLNLVVKKDLRIAFTLSYITNVKDFIFNSEYFKVLSNMYEEEEVIRVTNKPINVKATFNNNPQVGVLTPESLKLMRLINQAISEL